MSSFKFDVCPTRELYRWWCDACEMRDWLAELARLDDAARRETMLAQEALDDGGWIARVADWERRTEALVGWASVAHPCVDVQSIVALATAFRLAFRRDGNEIAGLRFDEVFDSAMFAHGALVAAGRHSPTKGPEPTREAAPPRPEKPGALKHGKGGLAPGTRAIGAALEMSKEGLLVSLKAVCERAGVDRANLRRAYPEAVEAIKRMAAPDRSPRRATRDRRTGAIDGVDDK